MTEKTEALRLADALSAAIKQVDADDDVIHVARWFVEDAAAELRRLSAVEAQRDALLEALQALYDEQQGPPLIRHQAAWEAAMQKARAAIKAVEGEKK